MTELVQNLLLIANVLALIALAVVAVFAAKAEKDRQETLAERVEDLANVLDREAKEAPESDEVATNVSALVEAQARLYDKLGALHAQVQKSSSGTGLGTVEQALLALKNDTSEIRKRMSEQEDQSKGNQRDLSNLRAELASKDAELQAANARIGELNRPIPVVASDRLAFEDILRQAVGALRCEVSSPELELAAETVATQAQAIASAVEGASRKDAEQAATLLDPTLFNPCSLPVTEWARGFEAKRLLEFARAGALELIGAYGFELDWPRLKVDSYKQASHDLRDSIITEDERLKGKIAEVRRPGLLLDGTVVRPSRVVQYAYDYRAVPPAVEELAAQVVTEPEVTIPVIDAPLPKGEGRSL